MSRYFTLKLPRTDGRPEEPRFEGDESFLGMNMALERRALPPGQYALAINRRAVRGVMETRPGTLTPVSANLEIFPDILGSGRYSNPNGQEVILIGTPEYAVVIQDGFAPWHVPYPDGMVLSGRLEFSQQFDKVLLHRGADPTPVDTTTNTNKPAGDRLTLQWGGMAATGFAPIEKSAALSELTLLPNADYAINFGDRAIIPIGKDQVAASEESDYSLVDLISNTFRVNAGTADAITGLYPYQQNRVIVGKERSIDALNNFIGSLNSVTAQILSTEIGISARRSGKMIGSDFVFLYKTGVYSLGQVDETRIAVSPVPIGARQDAGGKIVDPIAPLITRIHWPYAKDAVAAVLAPYYFLAVPLDEATVNNAVLVFNTVTGQWEAYDTWDEAAGMQIDNLIVSDYAGQPALYAINQAKKSVHILYRGAEDELEYLRPAMEGDPTHSVYQIADLFETRAYGKGDNEFKAVVIGFSTWRPRFTVTELVEGRNDERLMTPNSITKDPRKHYRAFMPLYDLTNAGNNFDEPSREDYAIVPPPAGVLPGKGIVPMWKQSRPERFAVRSRGRSVSFRIENTQGQCDINGIVFESVSDGKGIKRAA